MFWLKYVPLLTLFKSHKMIKCFIKAAKVTYLSYFVGFGILLFELYFVDNKNIKW